MSSTLRFSRKWFRLLLLSKESMPKRTVRSEFGEVSVRETGILFARVFSGYEIDLKRAKEYHSLVSYLSSSQPHVTIIDISSIKSITAEARLYLQNISTEWGKTLAVALITNSAVAKVVGNMFLSFNKPNYPVKVFSDSLDAHSWAKNEYLRLTTSKAS